MIDLEPLPVAVALLRAGIASVLLVAIHRRDVAAAINALVSLGVALLPAALAATAWLDSGPAIPLWLAVAGLLHSVGMLGPYDSVWWWDHLTHTVSAALVAALIYAALLVGSVGVPGGAAVTTVLCTFVVGVLWELVELLARDLGEEYGVQPVLVRYGRYDTAADLCFDVAAAVLVVVVDLRPFVPVLAQVGDVRALFRWTGMAVLVGTVLVASLVVVVRAASDTDD
jgi:hypothetical protein